MGRSRTMNLNKDQPNSNGGKRKSQENIIDRAGRRISGSSSSSSSSSKHTNTTSSKITKTKSLHKLLFVDGWLKDGTQVTYYNQRNGKKILKGTKKGRGIICDHCEENISASKFEDHAQFGKRRKPYQYIFTSNMESLQDLYISLIKEKQIACVLCREYDFCKSYFGPRTSIICDQCEREYHVGCLKKYNMEDIKKIPKGNWFCCEDCESLYRSLHNLVDAGEKPLRNIFADNFEVGWRLLNSKESSASKELKSLLKDVLNIFKDCFKPIKDVVTGDDLIPSMVYGKIINGQDFKGMYCAMLTIKDTSGMSKVVSAGIVRVLGREIAELPLAATHKDYQNKGYFKVLFGCIEKLLASLDVKNFILPATKKAESMWTSRFDFQKMPEEKISEYSKVRWQIMNFKGTSMLEKTLPKCD